LECSSETDDFLYQLVMINSFYITDFEKAKKYESFEFQRVLPLRPFEVMFLLFGSFEFRLTPCPDSTGSSHRLKGIGC
jgi:hypothetical protein